MQMTTGGDHDVENAECVADRGLSRQVPRTVRSPSALRQVVPEELLRALRVSLAVTLQETAMAPNDTDIHRSGTRPGSMGRFDPRASGNLAPYLIGAAILFAILYMYFGDSTATRTPAETTAPQTTSTPAPAPTTK